jgi:heterogeneous nuclear ribonucleoprotein R
MKTASFVEFEIYLKNLFCSSGKLSPEDLDERAMDALKEYNPDDAIAVLKQFCESSLEHVGNKSAFLCGMMKTYRQNKKQGAQASPARGPDPAKLSVSVGRERS